MSVLSVLQVFERKNFQKKDLLWVKVSICGRTVGSTVSEHVVKENMV